MRLEEGFHDLIPLFAKWDVGDDVDRGQVISAATDEELQDLVDRVMPRLDEIKAYLDSLSSQDWDAEIHALFTLTMSADEAETELDLRWATKDFPE